MATGFVALKLLLVAAAVGVEGLPFGVPPSGNDAMLGRVAPEECLVFVAWSGSGEPSADTENATEGLLAEPEVQHFLTEIDRLVRQAVERGARESAGRDRAFTEFAATAGELLISHPTAVFVEKLEFGDAGPKPLVGLFSILGDDAARATKSLDKLLEVLPPDAVSEVTVGGAKMRRIQTGPEAPPVTVGVRDGFLVIGMGEGAAEGIVERARTKPPAWLVGLVRRLPVERRSVVKYVNVKKFVSQFGALPPAERAVSVLKGLGLENVESLNVVAGLDETGFVTRVLLKTDGPPSGLLGVVGGEPLTAADLAPIPRDATLAVAARLDAAKALETVRRTVARIEPEFPARLDAGFSEMERELGIDVRKDVFGSLGDVWCVYHSPAEGGLLLGAAAVVKVKDRERLSRAAESLFEKIRDKTAGNPFAPRLTDEEFRGRKIYVVSGGPGMVVAPAWCVAGDELVVALFPQTVRAYLSRGDDFKSLAEQPAVAQALAAGGGPSLISYQDTPRIVELAYPFIQFGSRFAIGELQREGFDVDETLLPSLGAIRRHLQPGASALLRSDDGLEIISRHSIPLAGAGPMLAALGGLGGFDGRSLRFTGEVIAQALFPARGREAASMNNLRQIALAMQNYHDQMGTLPPAYTAKDGKPLLSWRVHILPYMEQAHLYEQFHLDEPWDSEHNKKLIPRMPAEYAAPGSKAGKGKTNYLTIRGKGTAFSGKDTLTLTGILDGTSNTVMVVEAGDGKAVEWTRPDDYDFDPMNPIRGLAGLRGDAILAVLGDGRAVRLDKNGDPEMFRRLFLRNDGQPLRMPLLRR